MANFKVFDSYAKQYDEWYNRHYDRYIAELAAIRELMPPEGRKLEIGIGTGRFAAPLGIEYGLDPAEEMLKIARRRGVTNTVVGTAETLPYQDGFFDYVLMTTTVCFLDDIAQAFAEVRRVLAANGNFTVAFIDKNSPLGRDYQHRLDSKFYCRARMYATEEIVAFLEQAGFAVTDMRQTLLNQSESHFEVRNGYGAGAFVVINSQKREN